MSSLDVAAERCVALRGERWIQSFPARDAYLGNLRISRALPIREKRLVGPWCFLDRYGPYSFIEGKPMDVAPHPHIGLQTVTWLLEGEVVHNDSIGCEGLIRPGGVNVMTSGSGIAHAEETPQSHTGRLNGVQLWIALPDAHRHVAASFQHIPEVPLVELGGGIARVFAGTFAGVISPAQHYGDLLGAELQLHRRMNVELPLNAAREHAVLLLTGDAEIEHQRAEAATLYYFGIGRTEINFRTVEGSRLLLIGGPPFPEAILMWWNFVARTPEEIAQARADWETHQRFGEVRAYRGPRLNAPPLMRLARPNAAS